MLHLPVCIWSFSGPVRVPGRCDIVGPVARLPSSPRVALEPAVSTLLRPVMLQRLRGCADTVVVDGKILLRGGKALTLNERDLYAEAQDRANSLIRRTGLEQTVASIWPMH